VKLKTKNIWALTVLIVQNELLSFLLQLHVCDHVPPLLELDLEIPNFPNIPITKYLPVNQTIYSRVSTYKQVRLF